VSSSAVAMVARGALDPRAAVAIVLGSNVGTVTTGLLASVFLGRGARWLAAADFVLNLAGALGALALFPLFYDAATLLAASPPQVVAHAHTLFNVAIALVALPLVRPAARWAQGGAARP
ncbi:MAG: Na/Pi symporter, partial [Bacillota bacterium]